MRYCLTSISLVQFSLSVSFSNNLSFYSCPGWVEVAVHRSGQFSLLCCSVFLSFNDPFDPSDYKQSICEPIDYFFLRLVSVFCPFPLGFCLVILFVSFFVPLIKCRGWMEVPWCSHELFFSFVVFLQY